MNEVGNYQPNSHKSKVESDNVTEKKVEKVVTGAVKVKKKSDVRKFADVFISEDISNVKNYILMDVLVPALKKAVSDIVTNGIDMILYGETGKSRRTTNASYVSYNRFSDRRDSVSTSGVRRATVGYSYDDITVDTRAEAEEVLSRMGDLIDMYGLVTVADLYDLVGVTGNYTDNKYGWTNIRNAEPVRVRDGYMLRLPRAMPID